MSLKLKPQNAYVRIKGVLQAAEPMCLGDREAVFTLAFLGFFPAWLIRPFPSSACFFREEEVKGGCLGFPSY